LRFHPREKIQWEINCGKEAWPCQHHQLFSEGTCCAILGRGSEKTMVQQDGEKGKMGGRIRAGCSQKMRDKGTPCAGTQEVWTVDWKAGKLAGERTYKWTRLFSHIPHQTTFGPLLAKLSGLPCHGFLPVIDTEALWEGRKWVEGTGGANLPNNICVEFGYTKNSGQDWNKVSRSEILENTWNIVNWFWAL